MNKKFTAIMLMLSMCAATVDTSAREPLEKTAATTTVEHFSICYGHSCKHQQSLGLTQAEWQEMENIFAAAGASAENERDQIRRAIARFEQLVGEKTLTSADLGGNWKGLGKAGQLDCIDESTNTTVYLTILQDKGLLRRHRVMPRSTRGWLLFGWPHSTAVIREQTSGEEYAVDSWFLDNGAPPYIVPLATWKAGWRPERIPPAAVQ